MSVDITEQTIGSADQRISLVAAEAAIKLSHSRILDGSWTRMRIGCRLCIGDTGADLTGTPRIYFGLHSNPATNLSNGVLGLTCSHFCGFFVNESTMTRIANSYSASNRKMGTVVGNTTAITSNTTDWYPSHTLATRRGALVVEFRRGSPNWGTTVCAAVENTDGAVDVSKAGLTAAMTHDPVATVHEEFPYANAVSDTNFAFLAPDEATNGLFDAILMASSHATAQVDFSDVVYSILE
jgi:hypothetical protein